MANYFCVLAGGGFGSLARYLVARTLVERFPNSNFATATFTINVTGSFLIGLLATLIVQRLHLPHYWYLAVVVGFLGGYTTFSTFEYDALLAVRAGHSLTALAYLTGSVVAGYGAVWFGTWLAGRS